MTGPADICNQALDAIGSPVFIGDIEEGSRESQVCLRHYTPILVRVFRERDWDFAERTVALTVLKTAPKGGYNPFTPWSTAYPPPPWRYEYSYPSDCLKVRCIKQAPIFGAYTVDPMPNVYRVVNDTNKVILTDVSNALLVYTGLITDPAQWNQNFMDAFVSRLALSLAAAFGKIDQGKEAAENKKEQDMVVTVGTADTTQG